MLVRLPAVRRRLLKAGHNGRCHHGRGAHRGLVGRQQDGTFQTARAKIYPPGLNAVLGEEMVNFAEKLALASHADALPDEFAIFDRLQEYADTTVVQRDYHG